MDMFEPTVVVGCEDEGSWKMAVASAGCEECADHFALKFLEICLPDVGGAEGAPNTTSEPRKAQ
jgi:hypothetical protein